MAPQSYPEANSDWSEQDPRAESLTPSSNAVGLGERRSRATESVIATDSDAFQSYILDMSHHDLISHEESLGLTRSMAEAKAVMVEQLARVPSASRKAVELCQVWIDSGAPLSQLLDTGSIDLDDSEGEERSAPINRQQLLSRIESLDKHYVAWRKRKTKIAANALARAFKRLGPNIHLLRDISDSCRDVATRLAPERAVGAAQVLAQLEQTAGTDRKTLDEVCREVGDAENRYAQAWKKMVQANLRLVIAVARRFSGKSVPLEDLVQEGNLGLFRAVEKYDYRLGYRFSTYASFWIRQAFTKALINQGRTMRVPAHMNDKIIKLLHVREELHRELGRLPTPSELASRSELPLESVQLAFESAQGTASLDQPIGNEDGGSFHDITADDSARTAEEARYTSELQNVMSRLLERLPEREATILRLRHGIGGTEPMTLQDIAQIIGVSRERVRQLEARAMTTLRVHIASDAADLEEVDESQALETHLTEE
jgi:RNA polymerase primary sigma factor